MVAHRRRSQRYHQRSRLPRPQRQSVGIGAPDGRRGRSGVRGHGRRRTHVTPGAQHHRARIRRGCRYPAHLAHGHLARRAHHAAQCHQ
ncbi:hypothetical protein GEMMAAP_19495 [Gemmatimonas phototrophica]|uniref:Uncharacterized protein n=1 Tax=Gemmatimonas phototrophica TaxID=1379270 RepID=A0A143BPD9_9BACT|nr:hypothetical protein GEMMAAP_19495 [Gemmatimonas phototrophica]